MKESAHSKDSPLSRTNYSHRITAGVKVGPYNNGPFYQANKVQQPARSGRAGNNESLERGGLVADTATACGPTRTHAPYSDEGAIVKVPSAIPSANLDPSSARKLTIQPLGVKSYASGQVPSPAAILT
ncbi:hypothetical protein TTRE_0000276001 [Trichuris trichiura]|uniref:Uncharacterized protein n=1 Tax=Trichuris trichiura TaxID=36087 RepID=A0A077Z748_TRITR|nr:hypothetical protein TTRE_0000276001 [Trichuris trichiura]